MTTTEASVVILSDTVVGWERRISPLAEMLRAWTTAVALSMTARRYPA